MNAGTCWEQEYNRPNGLSVEKAPKNDKLYIYTYSTIYLFNTSHVYLRSVPSKPQIHKKNSEYLLNVKRNLPYTGCTFLISMLCTDGRTSLFQRSVCASTRPVGGGGGATQHLSTPTRNLRNNDNKRADQSARKRATPWRIRCVY